MSIVVEAARNFCITAAPPVFTRAGKHGAEKGVPHVFEHEHLHLQF